MTLAPSDRFDQTRPPDGHRVSPALSLDGEVLAGEMAWLRRLARALVRDDAAADDLVQDALSVVLGRSAPIGDLRGFLAGTVRRLARRASRAEARRGAREAARPALDAEALPGADELAERVDLLRAVLAELEHLTPSQRRAVSLRFLQDMAPEEIAARTGSAPATVRAHLSRGLAALRSRLDARAGGRDGWTLAIAAWVDRDSKTQSAASTIDGGLLSPATVPRAVPSTTAKGVMMMATWKIGALVAAPLLAATAWVLSGHAPGDAVSLEPAPRAVPPAAAELSAIPARSARVAAPVPDETDDAGAASAGAAVPAASVELHSVAWTAVDELTREAVPFVRLEFTRHGIDQAPIELHALTDATGTFLVDDVLLPEGSLDVVASDLVGHRRSPAVKQSVAFPFAAPLEVAVGPTFALDLVGGDGVDRETLLVEYLAAGSEPGISRYETGLRSSPSPVMAARDASWVRFPSGVTALDPAADWEVFVQDPSGFWVGRAAVTRIKGIEHAPLHVRLEPRGAVEVRLVDENGAQRPGTRVDLEELSTGQIRRVFLGQHSADGTARGYGRCLTAGTYRWNTVPGDSTGEVEVTAGQIAVVEISPDQLGTVFDTHVAIDATRCPAANPGDWFVLVAREDEPSTGFMTSPSRVESAGRDGWRIELPGLPDGRWTVAIDADGSVELDASIVSVGPGDPPPTVIVRPAEPPLSVYVRAVDAQSGAPVPSAQAGYIVTARDSGELARTANGGFEPALVAKGAAVTFSVLAPGYRLTTKAVEPTEDGVAHTVRLERGWRGRVVVVDVVAQALLEGVHVIVDGELTGATDTNGSLWIEGEGPPRRLEISSPDATLKVLTSPMDSPHGLAAQPVLGWVFAVVGS